MNWKQRVIVVVCVMLAVLAGVMVPFAMAQDGPFDSPIEPPAGPELPDVDVGGVEDYVASVGIGAVIMVVVEILKRLGVLPDGTAGRWATVANILVFTVLVVAGIFDVNYTGDQAQAIYDMLERVGQAILTIISSPLLYRILRDAEVFRARGS